jgi:hypothetical protein
MNPTPSRKPWYFSSQSSVYGKRAKMKLARRKIALQLSSMDDDEFIETYQDLKDSLHRLVVTASEKSINLNELERLYHSCRRQGEVAKECFELIKVTF